MAVNGDEKMTNHSRTNKYTPSFVGKPHHTEQVSFGSAHEDVTTVANEADHHNQPSHSNEDATVSIDNVSASHPLSVLTALAKRSPTSLQKPQRL